MEDFLANVGSGGAIGSGAIAGAILIIQFMRIAMKEVKEELQSMSRKLDEVIISHEVSKARNDTEVEFIKVRILELDKRIERLEQKLGH